MNEWMNKNCYISTRSCLKEETAMFPQNLKGVMNTIYLKSTVHLIKESNWFPLNSNRCFTSQKITLKQKTHHLDSRFFTSICSWNTFSVVDLTTERMIHTLVTETYTPDNQTTAWGCSGTWSCHDKCRDTQGLNLKLLASTIRKE